MRRLSILSFFFLSLSSFAQRDLTCRQQVAQAAFGEIGKEIYEERFPSAYVATALGLRVEGIRRSVGMTPEWVVVHSPTDATTTSTLLEIPSASQKVLHYSSDKFGLVPFLNAHGVNASGFSGIERFRSGIVPEELRLPYRLERFAGSDTERASIVPSTQDLVTSFSLLSNLDAADRAQILRESFAALKPTGVAIHTYLLPWQDDNRWRLIKKNRNWEDLTKRVHAVLDQALGRGNYHAVIALGRVHLGSETSPSRIQKEGDQSGVGDLAKKYRKLHEQSPIYLRVAITRVGNWPYTPTQAEFDEVAPEAPAPTEEPGILSSILSWFGF